MRAVLAVLMAIVASVPGAATAADARGETESLIASLAGSGCGFERNGSRHGAAEAQTHLRRKYAALLRRSPDATAEQFIVHAATRSSVSGEPYLVHCPGSKAMDSATWFQERLRTLRGGRPK